MQDNDSKKVEQNQLPEAVASVTYSVVSPNGYPALFTIRGTSGANLLGTMALIEKTLLEKAYKPQEKKSFGGFQKKETEFVEGKLCPLCQGRLVVKESKIGKKFHKCENGKFDFATKQNTGCTYVDWLEPNAQQQM